MHTFQANPLILSVAQKVQNGDSWVHREGQFKAEWRRKKRMGHQQRGGLISQSMQSCVCSAFHKKHLVLHVTHYFSINGKTAHQRIHTHTHVYISIYIYVYMQFAVLLRLQKSKGRTFTMVKLQLRNGPSTNVSTEQRFKSKSLSACLL